MRTLLAISLLLGTAAAMLVPASAPMPLKLLINLPKVQSLKFEYPAHLDPDQYFWSVESSTDLVAWTNYCEVTNPVITVFADEAHRFWRVKGEPR